MDKETILIVDDEESIRTSLSILLKTEGYHYRLAGDLDSAINILNNELIDLVLLDLNLGNSNGIDILKHIQGKMEAIIITAFGSVGTAVEAMKQGAFDYLTKPVNNDELVIVIKKAIEQQKLKNEITLLRNEFKEKYYYKNIVAKSQSMREVLSIINRVAKTDVTMLIEGESGTGKELVAKALHNESNRQNGPFIALNCGAIQDSLLESELFGHVKGSFTGAAFSRKGLFEEATGGTLFLDEIDTTPLSTQVKLLRVLQENKIKRVGSNEFKKIDVRIISASNKNLKELAEKNNFREDLYYRLKVVRILIPPLRERKEDIVPLCEHFLKMYNAKLGKHVSAISPEAYSLILNHQWMGNVRELEHSIESSLVMCPGEKLRIVDLPSEVAKRQQHILLQGSKEKLSMEDMEKLYILQVLSETEGNQKKAAKILNIGRNTLWRKMNKYKLEIPTDWKEEN